MSFGRKPLDRQTFGRQVSDLQSLDDTTMAVVDITQDWGVTSLF
jgi:hypothetical protein